PGINYFGHTSTMEYQSARIFESVGLGQYDLMSMGALYGKVLETFDATRLSADAQKNSEHLLRTQLSADLFVGNDDGGASGRHYTRLAREAGVLEGLRCRNASDEEKAQAEWRIVHSLVCAPPRKDLGHWDDFTNESDPGSRRSNAAPKLRIPASAAVPAAGNVRWPYRFGGDQMNGYLHVNPFDSGADQYEVTRETIEKNDFNYPFIYFRRERRDWTSIGLPSYTARMFYERLRSYHWGTAFLNTFYQDL